MSIGLKRLSIEDGCWFSKWKHSALTSSRTEISKIRSNYMPIIKIRRNPPQPVTPPPSEEEKKALEEARLAELSHRALEDENNPWLARDRVGAMRFDRSPAEQAELDDFAKKIALGVICPWRP